MLRHRRKIPPHTRTKSRSIGIDGRGQFLSPRPYLITTEVKVQDQYFITINSLNATDERKVLAYHHQKTVIGLSVGEVISGLRHFLLIRQAISDFRAKYKRTLRTSSACIVNAKKPWAKY
jgi:hypothetical protein